MVQDPNLHIKHLKPSPVASEIVDHCIECGFFESNCPSRDITLTPRQRIASYKGMARLQQLPSPTSAEQQRCVLWFDASMSFCNGPLLTTSERRNTKQSALLTGMYRHRFTGSGTKGSTALQLHTLSN